MSAHQAEHRIAVMAQVPGVSRSGYYAWRSRPTSWRTQVDARLKEDIRVVHATNGEAYGAPRIHFELREQGWKVGRKRIARLMRELGICGVTRRRRFRTTVKNAEVRPAPDLVDRKFVAHAPDELWVADITYVPTATRTLYLAVALDACSRRVVGWAMATHMRTELVLAALEMAIGQRRPREVIHHSDQGSQYTALAFGHRCRGAGIRPSMGWVGDCYDNAMAESFFATLECELLDRTCQATSKTGPPATFKTGPPRRPESEGGEMTQRVSDSFSAPERGTGREEMRTPDEVFEMRRLRGLGWGTP